MASSVARNERNRLDRERRKFGISKHGVPWGLGAYLRPSGGVGAALFFSGTDHPFDGASFFAIFFSI